MGKFDGRVVLITGGARGQGRSHALRFARDGADVAFCDLAGQLDTVPYAMATPDDVAETVKQVENLGRRCIGVAADVREQVAVTAFVEEAKAELGRVDFLLANAGIGSFSPMADMAEDVWDQMISTNLTGMYHAFRAVLPTMIEQKFGRIVATSSMLGKSGMRNMAHYCAAKWGAIGLVKSVAQEVANDGITVNAICSTTVETDMILNAPTYQLFVPEMPNPTLEDTKPRFTGMNAISVPWVDPIDVSNAMAFLCSDEARYITGETIAVAAGQNTFNAG